ncbi:hypothetical protein FGADI_519 [Fusarium gaditjirri]|uniref:Uncharacterized protein n=1 Tax=Fusarium gaditjirri TaxID=282569 RepID=A0A8H4TNE8_9HYPO|nr:hypothetical protein FGADI_519 [Fusarium gaditjirri]
MPRHNGISYELLFHTPGLSFPAITRRSQHFTSACLRVFIGLETSQPSITPTSAAVEDKICEFLTECYNNFHSLTICPTHDFMARPCACHAAETQYYNQIGSSLNKSWKRFIDSSDIKAIIEAILYARIEAIKDKGPIITHTDNLILLNAHILVCTFAEFKHSHGYRHVDGLFWTVTGAIEQKQEAQTRKETLLKQREAKSVKPVPGKGDVSATDVADTEEKFVMLPTCY